MAVKTERLETRISPGQRAMLERAASLAGTSVSAFVVAAAMEHAEELTSAQMSTTVPADYFDRLTDALDQPGNAKTLARAARRAAQRKQIAGR